MQTVSRETLTPSSPGGKKDGNTGQDEASVLNQIQGHLRNGTPMALTLAMRLVNKRLREIKEKS